MSAAFLFPFPGFLPCVSHWSWTGEPERFPAARDTWPWVAPEAVGAARGAQPQLQGPGEGQSCRDTSGANRFLSHTRAGRPAPCVCDHSVLGWGMALLPEGSLDVRDAEGKPPCVVSFRCSHRGALRGARARRRGQARVVREEQSFSWEIHVVRKQALQTPTTPGWWHHRCGRIQAAGGLLQRPDQASDPGVNTSATAAAWEQEVGVTPWGGSWR